MFAGKIPIAAADTDVTLVRRLLAAHFPPVGAPPHRALSSTGTGNPLFTPRQIQPKWMHCHILSR